MKKIIKNIVLLSFLLLAFQLKAQDVIWFSNTPPKEMEKMFKTSGMHRWSAIDSKKINSKPREGNNENKYNKKIKKDSASSSKPVRSNKSSKRSYRPTTKYVQWIRSGSSVKDAAYICLDKNVDYTIDLFSPTGKKENINLIKDQACYVKFEMKDEGYYNAYLKIKKVKGDTLYINIAKAELINHSCRNGHHKKLEARPVNTYPKVSEFEVYRKRQPYEDYHYFTFSGGNETFKAIYLGKPVSDVKVTINTEKGWSKTMLSDENGEVNTKFIQDYFSEWKELEHRKIFYYMLEAEYTVKKDINYKGKEYSYIHYTLTMSDGYRPSKTMYSSMLWGLIVFVITLVISIGGVFIYKERRKKPYKEITFKET
ncbi:hypothetical protein [Lutibacter sp.]